MSQDMIYKTMVKDEILPKLKKIYDKAMIEDAHALKAIEELGNLIDDIEKKIKLQESIITTTITYSHDGTINND